MTCRLHTGSAATGTTRRSTSSRDYRGFRTLSCRQRHSVGLPRPRPRVTRRRANALIDRGMSLLVDDPGRSGFRDQSGGLMAVAALISACAQRINYPDMESVLMRVMSGRPCWRFQRLEDRNDLVRALMLSAVPLALVDPDVARSVLEQVESLGGSDPNSLSDVREAWLTAWARRPSEGHNRL